MTIVHAFLAGAAFTAAAGSYIKGWTWLFVWNFCAGAANLAYALYSYGYFL